MIKPSDEASIVKTGEETATSEATQKTVAETTEQTTTTTEEMEVESPYKAELEKAKAALVKKDELIRKKDGALKESRQLLKDAQTKPEEVEEEEEKKPRQKALSADEVRELYREERNAERFDDMLSSATNDQQERELIKLHYDNSIKRTGDVAADFKKALAIANQPLLDQARNAQFEREQEEGKAADRLGGGSYNRPGLPAYNSDPALKAAARILDRLDGDGKTKKYLGR